MVDVVTQWKKNQPYTVDVKLSSFFPKANDKPEHNDYPQVLMDTKICLSPRGTHLETYRLCEGMYYGCVVIAEEQPNHWFAETSPAIILHDWNDLPNLLDKLLKDPQQLANRQQASLDYWDKTLAPTAVSAYVSDSLNKLSPSLAANDATYPEETSTSRAKKTG